MGIEDIDYFLRENCMKVCMAPFSVSIECVWFIVGFLMSLDMRVNMGGECSEQTRLFSI